MEWHASRHGNAERSAGELDRDSRAYTSSIDRDYGIYDGRTFKADRWAAWLASKNIPWPRLPSGVLDLSWKTPSSKCSVHSRSRQFVNCDIRCVATAIVRAGWQSVMGETVVCCRHSRPALAATNRPTVDSSLVRPYGCVVRFSPSQVRRWLTSITSNKSSASPQHSRMMWRCRSLRIGRSPT